MKQQRDLEASEPRQPTGNGRGLVDAILVALCVCLLLGLGVMLRPRRPHPIPGLPDVPDDDTPFIPDGADGPRERLMSLGIALLLVSLGVCLYTMYRLGFCCVRADHRRAALRRGLPSVNSRLHLISAADLPPSYDAIMFATTRSVDLHPPSYYAVVVQDEKVSPGPCPAPAAPAGPRVHCCAAGAAEAASRPQEAG